MRPSKHGAACVLRRAKELWFEIIGARLKNLQTASPYALKLALTLESDDMAGDEAYYHQQFAKDRVSENSEWFRYSRGLKQFMESENESR